MKSSFIGQAASLATLAFFTNGVVAQSPPKTSVAPTLKEVTVIANPLGATDPIAPVTQYSGTKLLLRSQSTLGETLDGTPGVSSTYFGPNASRPIIRGLDGDRIRVLQNSGASIDASGLSFDHAVPSDPISMERIEVLRGPGALLSKTRQVLKFLIFLICLSSYPATNNHLLFPVAILFLCWYKSELLNCQPKT